MKLAPSLALAAVTLGGSACFVDTDPDPVVVYEPTTPLAGTLTVRWTIAGLADPNLCFQFAAQAIEIRVLDPRGAEVGAWQQDCAVFATSITLGAGAYGADAFLVDAANRPRTTAVPITPFTIRGNDVLDIPIDFPPDSFF